MSEHQSDAGASRPPVGAWVWEDVCFDNPHDSVKLAQDIGFDFLHLAVNARPSPGEGFELHLGAKVQAFAAAAQQPKSGQPLSVGFTSWIVPNQEFIEDAAKALIPLCKEFDAISLVWDAEGPWNLGGTNAQDSAAQLVDTQFADLSCPMGVSSYGDIPTWVKSLAQQCRIGAPQIYSPDQGLTPGKAQQEWEPGWKHTTGSNNAPLEIMMGLGAYSQGADRDAVMHNMTAAYQATLDLAPHSICYWSLGWLAEFSTTEPNQKTENQLAQEVLTGLLGGTLAPPSDPKKGSGHGSGVTYEVKPGDTMSKIAANHAVTLAALLSANPQITNPDLIAVGQMINIP